MILVRQIGLALLAAAAVAVFFVMEPEEGDLPPDLPTFAPEASDYADLVDQALADFEANEARADSAPQQQVVAGWVAKDLLTVVALEGAQNVEALDTLTDQNDLIYRAATTREQRDDRPAALLVIGVLAISLWGATSGQPTIESGRSLKSNSKTGATTDKSLGRGASEDKDSGGRYRD